MSYADRVEGLKQKLASTEFMSWADHQAGYYSKNPDRLPTGFVTDQDTLQPVSAEIAIQRIFGAKPSLA